MHLNIRYLQKNSILCLRSIQFCTPTTKEITHAKVFSFVCTPHAEKNLSARRRSSGLSACNADWRMFGSKVPPPNPPTPHPPAALERQLLGKNSTPKAKYTSFYKFSGYPPTLWVKMVHQQHIAGVSHTIFSREYLRMNCHLNGSSKSTAN